MTRALLFIPLIASLLLAACAVSADRNRPWTATDLRRLDPAGDASSPSTDILAVYTRTTAWEVQIRVDLLDLSSADVPAMKIFLYDNHNYATSPLEVDIPAGGRPRAVQPTGRQTLLRPRLVSDPRLATVTVGLSRLYVGDRYHLNVETLLPGSTLPVDESGEVASDGPPAAGRTPLLLAFWDAFPAATPAQALRRWDGAHTGPNGGRHGLKHVLDNAEQYRIPLALLDLKTPASLAALAYLGGRDRIRRMQDRGLLILPDVAYGEPAQVSLGFSRRAAAGFGLPAGQFVYAPYSGLLPASPAQFVSLPGVAQLLRAGDTRLIPMPAPEAVQATDDGPALDVRRRLVTVALASDPSGLVVLGGDLPRSTWGNAQAADSTFAWLAAHPWIQPLFAEDLLTLPAGAGNPPPPQAAAPPAAMPLFDSFGNQLPSFSLPNLLAELKAAPEDPLSDLAWQTYFALTAPTDNLELQDLRSQYYRNVASLLAASRWAENGTPPVDGCDANGYDGQPACILSNQHFLAMFKIGEGQLNFLFYRDEHGVHQIISPSSQFTIGLSDPSEWKLERGPRADPSVIDGAFADGIEVFLFQPGGYTQDSLTFRSPDGSFSKAYRLTEDGVEVAYHVTSPMSTHIPLAIDPQAFFFGPAVYQGSLAPGSWTWGLADGLRVEVRSDAALSAEGFTSSLPFLSQPENPDLEYPPGHYLPFPLAMVTLNPAGDFHVQISIK